MKTLSALVILLVGFVVGCGAGPTAPPPPDEAVTAVPATPREVTPRPSPTPDPDGRCRPYPKCQT